VSKLSPRILQILFTCLVVPAVGGSLMGCGEGGTHPVEAASIGAGTGTPLGHGETDDG